MDSEYRIVSKKRNGTVGFMIQKRSRLLWVGPYVWKTFVFRKHHYFLDDGWTLISCFGEVFKNFCYCVETKYRLLNNEENNTYTREDLSRYFEKQGL